MSKNKKVEQIIQHDKVYSTTGKDNVGNKSTSSSSSSSSSSILHPIEQQENQQHQQSTATIEVEQWQPSEVSTSASQGSSSATPAAVVGVQATPEHMRGGAAKDMFDLIERVQCSRIDDQRCVLPAYFSQVPY